MSQQHPSFPSHLPRGVAASALTIPRAAPQTMLRTGPVPSPTIQIPSAPPVPSASGSVTGLPSSLVRSPVISAIRTGVQPCTTTSGSVNLTDQRTSLIVQGPPGAGTSIQGQPLQITLTQRVNPVAPPLSMSLNPSGTSISMSEAMKLAPLGGKPVQVAPAGLLQTQKMSLSAQPASATPAGMGLMPQLQHSAVLVASKAGGLQVSASVPAISISPMTPTMPSATVVTPVSSPQIPIAKVTPQRQQQVTLTPAGLTVQMVTTSGSEVTHVPSLSSITTQAAGGGQLLQLSQTQQQQRGPSVVAATLSSSSSTTVLTSSIPAGGGGTAGSVIQQQPTERLTAPTMFNLTATTPGQGQDATWFSQFLLPQNRAQLVSAPPSNPSANALPRPPTFFVPRAGEPNKIISNPTPNLTASLSHPMPQSQPTVLFNTNMMVEGLRTSQPLGAGAVGVTMGVPPSSSMAATMTDSKPGASLSLSGSSTQSGLHPIMVAGTVAASGRSSDASIFTSTTPLPVQSSAALMSGNASLPVLPPNLGNAAIPAHLSTRATVASSLLTMVTPHQSQPVTSTPAQGPSTPGGLGSSNSNSGVSPRPSILRKRNVDGTMVTPKKPNFSMLAESHSPRPDPVPPCGISSPKTPATENSQSSTDTALSSNDGGTPTQNGERIKAEPAEGTEAGPTAGSSAAQTPGSGAEASPRKRARKQLFDLSRRKLHEDSKANTSSEEEEEDEMEDPRPLEPMDIKDEESLYEERDEFIDEEGVRWTKERTKPTMSLMSDNSFDWKPRFNHFQRYSDVKSKADDRNPTLNELISQRGIVQKASGWKLYYVSTQVEEVMENEEDLEQRLEKLKERLDAEASSRPSNEQDFHRLLELARGNLQRCKVVRQQLMEAKSNMLNLLKHEPKIKEIITKNLAKRAIKKKERC